MIFFSGFLESGYPKNGPNAGKYYLRGASELPIFWGEYVCGCV